MGDSLADLMLGAGCEDHSLTQVGQSLQENQGQLVEVWKHSWVCGQIGELMTLHWSQGRSVDAFVRVGVDLCDDWSRR